MKAIIFNILLILTPLLAYSSQRSFIPSRIDRIDIAIQRLIDNEQLPHAVTYVVHNGEIIHHKAYGWRDKEQNIPCRTDDIFRIASQTKAITAVALMTLWEEGLFFLDDPIKKYIPEFANPQILDKYDSSTGKYTTRPAKNDITIRHLLTHTSGISYGGEFWNIAIDAGIAPLNSLDSLTLEEMVRKIGKMPLKHEPGEAFTYSMNTDVLGHLIEILTGKPIDEVLQERIFSPLKMNDTYFYLPAEKVERLVKLYEYPRDGKLQLSQNKLNQTFPYAGAKTLHSTGAGLNGTIADYGRFCQMILNDGILDGQRILSRKTLEFMQRNQVGDLRGTIGFGLAWDVHRPEHMHKTVVSEGTMRWGGMFGTDYIIDPVENLIVIIYTNCMPNMSGSNHKTLIHNMVYQALE